MATLMNILIEQPFHIIIGNYLYINDNKNLIKLNKEIYNNKISKKYFKKIVIEKSKKIIYRFMKKYVNYIKYVNNFHNYIYEFHINDLSKLITKKMNAVYYFKNYEKKHINPWYNLFKGWKKDLIDKYKNKYDLKKENPSRYDLYKLIKKMNIEEVYSIGW
jgi:hypothetical protein